MKGYKRSEHTCRHCSMACKGRGAWWWWLRHMVVSHRCIPLRGPIISYRLTKPEGEE